MQKMSLISRKWMLGRFVWRSLLCAFVLFSHSVHAQSPKCAPTATFTYLGVKEPEAVVSDSYSGSAPVKAEFKANPSGLDESDGMSLYSARYEWKIFDTAMPESPFVHRFEEDMEYTFQSSGSFSVELSATFIHGTDTIYYPEEGDEATRFTISISESKLEMPNAFSPNGDGYNDTYKAKDTHQGIISFRATIFNRWGQKLYSWNDVNGEWDGKVNGKVVPDGVYFVNVVAKGADGHDYHIRKDVNVLTRTTETTEGGTTDE